MASNNVLNVSDSSFEADIEKSALPVLLDFTATWCGPCKAIAPLIDQVADAQVGKLKVAKVDVDQCRGSAMKYGIRSVPTLLLMKNGNVVGQHVGTLSKSALDEFVAKAL